LKEKHPQNLKAMCLMSIDRILNYKVTKRKLCSEKMHWSSIGKPAQSAWSTFTFLPKPVRINDAMNLTESATSSNTACHPFRGRDHSRKHPSNISMKARVPYNPYVGTNLCCGTPVPELLPLAIIQKIGKPRFVQPSCQEPIIHLFQPSFKNHSWIKSIESHLVGKEFTASASVMMSSSARGNPRMDKLLEEAEKANEVLRFVGAVEVKSGKASVKLDRYPKVQCWIGMDSKPLKYITY